ncbi:hypothetical protein [Frankia sp. Cas4]|uniref:hypothetical protein n=1 Tax=Frankia sp. Cas4 TaxID=3073927 RepID=UPI002AD354FF|nr:hypothetical protein [Frankia sp. Cas4]
MSGYVLDDLALSAGLAGTGSEHHRRELSRLLRGAIDGGAQSRIAIPGRRPPRKGGIFRRR